MIVSASRRTDIPAFYGQWLTARLRAGEAWVRNPYNRKLLRVDLRPEAVDGIVLWSKNPAPMLPLPSELEPYPYYFQFTLNPYGPPLEPGLPDAGRRVETFRELSRRLGRHRVVWRYDPVILSPRTPAQYHLEQFGRLAGALSGHTDRCVISFMDPYAKIRRRLSPYAVREASPEETAFLARGFAGIAGRLGLCLSACCEPGLPADCGVSSGRCVDAELLGRIAGRPLNAPPDRGGRPGCGCARSVDIGAYDTCGHGCLYCYANASPARVRRNMESHDPGAAALAGAGRDGRIPE